MHWVFLAILVVHRLIHFINFAKAFRFAELPQLTMPISRGINVLWLVAGLAVLAAAVMLPLLPR
jgi:hypothetical protein